MTSVSLGKEQEMRRLEHDFLDGSFTPFAVDKETTHQTINSTPTTVTLIPASKETPLQTITNDLQTVAKSGNKGTLRRLKWLRVHYIM